MKHLLTLTLILFGLLLIFKVSIPVPVTMLLLGCSLLGIAGRVKHINLKQQPAKPHRKTVQKTAPSL